MATNQAAWIKEAYSHPFVVEPAELPRAGPHDLVIKNHALAINPVDWKVQTQSPPFVAKYPFILGSDVAGEVYEVGSEVENFKVGDRVIAEGHAFLDGKSTSGAFQNYTAVDRLIAVKLPPNLTYTEGVVLPLALNTAITGLYPEEILGLPLPSVNPIPVNKILLIWGGSSSVGAAAIQLAKASGLTVIATASAPNHDLVKSHLRADHVFDHNAPDVVTQIAQTVKDSGKEFAGVYDAIALPTSLKLVTEVFEQLRGLGARRLAVTLLPQGLPDDIQTGQMFALTVLTKHRSIAEHVWGRFLYEALEKGVIKPLPEPMVIGKGLESVQKAVDRLKEGVSAKKVVVEL
ncbi:hypothetical protein CAC42_4366 [Sphaceloma murrayae]|uniref:Enoyl reductase (ER) domain-containing protein n=1 Tax=Sphaceloma murrayae TaxID=2082308 RepID=A0A2K1QLC9_9PEZI|nr:hypothetical protein CAC42_4366 [Sphaceloma murrayae]